jgi:ribosomal protein L32
MCRTEESMMATCAKCGAEKLSERACPKCGRFANVGDKKPVRK